VMVRKVGRVLAALTLVMSAAACDDNPLSEDRDEAAYFRLNPSNAAVNAGGTIRVDATVVNKYGAATNAAVTATPCDNKVTAVVDTGRTSFEFPERFIVTGAALGTSCLVVRGGGVTDTVEVRVVPASIRATVDTVGSGESKTISVQFRDAAGNPVSGMSLADVTFTTLTGTIAQVTSAGVVSGQAPGQGAILVSLSSAWGASRVDTVRFTVKAGAFSGTVTQGTAGAATGAIQTVTFTQGAIPFDTDTQVRLYLGTELLRTFALTAPTGSITQVLPFGLPAGALRYEVINIGPNQIATVGTLNLPSGTPAADTAEPDESFNTPKSMVPGEVFWGSLGGDDEEDVIRLTITEAGTYTVNFQWNEVSGNGDTGSDFDMYVLSSAGAVLLRQETFAAAAENGSVALQPGTYYIDLATWAYVGVEGRPSTYRVAVTKQ
jgi:hypothetical protein